mmetsp:Transcript_2485/g.4969  ORF Transcript_2485/g.4969 Transcript_2485/m.4969 type:complete len:139 (-) Transcript_2485:144-560(-)|eukprot:CAMPEP_0116931292 /NCGR_PEP_ID=MMETSP0467-20121206/27726_1 /TAXON_ID=283647 /ORGANISM="Mesodinium pulex, Strain SPMC105" /LENGTH=138 /DNA_ID=CAMNT_0004611697 /DNA_START=110 /DNA_END=526 /DNA_ORIENTATION=+
MDTVPTVGLNVKTIKLEGLSLKVWDIGGQIQYRAEWANYCRDSDAIVYMVDASDKVRIAIARKELHLLLDSEGLKSIPILIICNKIDIENHLSEEEVLQGLNLDYITDNPWAIVSISALKSLNLDKVVDWLKDNTTGN